MRFILKSMYFNAFFADRVVVLSLVFSRRVVFFVNRLRDHTTFLSRVLYWTMYFSVISAVRVVVLSLVFARRVVFFWHDGDMSSTMCRWRCHVDIGDDTTWHVVDVESVGTLMSFVRNVGILAFNFRVFVQRRRVVDDVSSSTCSCRRRHEIPSTSTIDLKTLRYATRLHNMSSFWHLLSVLSFREHNFLSIVLKLCQHKDYIDTFFIAWHSAVWYSHLTCISVTLEQIRVGDVVHDDSVSSATWWTVLERQSGATWRLDVEVSNHN